MPSRASQSSRVYGRFGANEPLSIRSRMPESGVILSDGMEANIALSQAQLVT